MKTGLDTSIVLRLLTGQPEEQAFQALEEVLRLKKTGTTLWVSDLVISEVYFALQYHYRIPKGETISMIDRLLSESGIQASGLAQEVVKLPGLATANPGFVDRLIFGEYLNSMSEVLTFEKAAARISGVRVLGRN